MTRLKMAGLSLVAMLMVGIVAAASASAVTVTILYPGGGSKPDFSSKTGPGKLATANETVECLKATNTGEGVPGTDRVKNVVITFEGCKATIKEVQAKCNSSGSGPEVIKTFPLEGEFGSFGEKTGLVLKALTTNKETLFAEFSCATTKVKVRGKERGTSGERGGIIAEILPESVNKLIDVGKAALLTYKQAEKEPTRQSPNELTVLGTNVTALLLEATSGGSGFELAGLEEEKNVEIFGLESFEISRK
jgi:hypothetical protein